MQVRFDLVCGEEWYPPQSIEYLWALPVDSDQYRIDNNPFFVLGVSCDDVVTAFPDDAQVLRFAGLSKENEHSTIRVIFYDNTLDDESLEECTRKIRQQLRLFGCASEQSHIPGLVSIDVPPDVEFRLVQDLLVAGAESKLWDYEEATVAH